MTYAPYHASSPTSPRTGFSPAGVLTVAWLTSGYWVEEWFPHMITFLTSDTWTFSLSETWPSALLWSSLVKQLMFFSGIDGANSFRIKAFVFAGLATTKTWNKWMNEWIINKIDWKNTKEKKEALAKECGSLPSKSIPW